MRRYRGFDTDNQRWDELDFRDGDIVISSPAKAGTTWTQMICALLVFRTPDLPAPLGDLSPWLDMQTQTIDQVIETLEAQDHRRFIKTHTPLDGLPRHPGVTFVGVGRHPLDLVLSAARHSGNIDFGVAFERVAATIGEDEALTLLADRPVPSQDPDARLRFFLDEEHPPEAALTLASVIAHYRTFFDVDAHVVTMHYSDMATDLDREMRRLAAALDIAVEESEWPDLVEAASFTEMKARADALVPGAGLGLFKDAGAFFARGEKAEWRSAVAPESVARFEARLGVLDPQGEVARWAVDGLYC